MHRALPALVVAWLSCLSCVVASSAHAEAGIDPLERGRVIRILEDRGITSGGTYTPPTPSGWTDTGGAIIATTVGDGVGIGVTPGSAAKFHVVGDATRGDVTIVGGADFRVEFLEHDGGGFNADGDAARMIAPGGELMLSAEASGGGKWLRFDSDSGPILRVGAGSPEGAITAPKGSLYLDSDGGNGTTLYVKASNTDATGWRAVSDAAP